MLLNREYLSSSLQNINPTHPTSAAAVHKVIRVKQNNPQWNLDSILTPFKFYFDDIFCSVDRLIVNRLSSHTGRIQVLAQPIPHKPVDLVQLSCEVAKAPGTDSVVGVCHFLSCAPLPLCCLCCTVANECVCLNQCGLTREILHPVSGCCLSSFWLQTSARLRIVFDHIG